MGNPAFLLANLLAKAPISSYSAKGCLSSLTQIEWTAMKSVISSSFLIMATGVGAAIALQPAVVSAKSEDALHSITTADTRDVQAIALPLSIQSKSAAQQKSGQGKVFQLAQTQAQPPASSGSETSPVPSIQGPGSPSPAQRPQQPNNQPTPPASNQSGQTPAIANPDTLNPSPNPLATPTRPQQVQTTNTQAITLAQALELARRNNRQLQAAELELERNRVAEIEARGAFYPTLSAGANLTFQESQGSVLDQLTGGASDPIDTSVSGTLQLNYDLFTSGRRNAALRTAEGQTRFQELQVETVKEQLRLDVSTAYYDMQQADEQVRIARDALAQAQRSLADAQALERAGVGTRFDVLQSQVDVANAQQDLTNALSQQQINRRTLVRRIGLAQDANVVSADPVAVAGDWPLTLEESIVQAYRNRAELEQQLVQREIAGQQRRRALSALGPQVSLFGNYGQSNTLNRDTGFSDNYSFGARLSINLFDGGVARAQARQQEINAQIAETQFADTRDNVRLQVEQAFLQLQSNRENIQSTALGLQTAREALRLARLRFQAGVGTQSDVLSSQTALTRAEVNQLNAILGYNRSLVSLQRAVSNLPGGVLTNVP
jgi:outer membrane protein TolC